MRRFPLTLVRIRSSGTAAGRLKGRIPEGVERAVERVQIFVPVHEQRAAHVKHVVAPRQLHRGERLDDVEHPSGVHVETETAKRPAELEQTLDQRLARRRAHTRFGTRADARARSSLTRPPTASTSSRALRTTPSVSRTPCSSTRSCPSAASADTQSMVSDTPGVL